jgi:hypothetical protein
MCAGELKITSFKNATIRSQIDSRRSNLAAVAYSGSGCGIGSTNTMAF